MQKFVVDTSVMARYFLSSDLTKKADILILFALQKKVKLYAPSLIYYELFSVFVQNYDLIFDAEREFENFLKLVNNGIIEIIEDFNTLHPRVFEISYSTFSGKLGYISPFDSWFHALAISLDCHFLTDDIKHYNKTKEYIGNITLLKDLTLPLSY